MNEFSCRKAVLCAVAVSFHVGACGGQAPAAQGAVTAAASPPAPTAPHAGPVDSAADETGATAAKAAPSSTWSLSDVAIVPARMAEAPRAMPKPWIESPGFEQVLPTDYLPTYKVVMKVPNWDQAPAGSYIQFVLDTRPLAPVTDFHNGLKLTDLAGPDGLADGEHVLAAYVCRPNHESIKGTAGVSVHRFWTGKHTAGVYHANAPMMILGGPNGHYKGDGTEDIVIDWYLLNAALGDKDYQVHMTLKGPGLKEEGIERYTKEWRPWTIVSAHPGDYTLDVELLDKNGTLVPGAWNSVKRTFTVDNG